MHEKRRLQNILHRLWESKEKIRPEVVEVRFLSSPSPMVIRIEEVFQVSLKNILFFFVKYCNYFSKVIISLQLIPESLAPPSRDHLKIEKDGRLINTMEPPPLIRDQQPTPEQSQRIKRYGEDIGKITALF